MRNLSKISALFLVVLLAFNSISKADPVSSINKAGHTKEKASIHPANNPNLFAIHHQEKTRINLLENLPNSNSAEHSQNNGNENQSAESSLQKQTAIYLRFCKTIDYSLTVKKLIFPFHSHW